MMTYGTYPIVSTEAILVWDSDWLKRFDEEGLE
jgi:hypothetical protein